VRVFWLASALLLANGVFAAEVYRQVDPDGTVTYSDRPASDGAETITIDTRTPVGPPPRAAEQPPADAQPASEAPAEPTEASPEDVAAEREANCAAARERNDRYQMSRRLYRPLPDGEREYLTDEELDAARAGAAADVEQWCN
jgi:hypothetical protein